MGFSWWLSGKESACNAGDSGDANLIPGWGKSSGGGHGNPFQYSCLENPIEKPESCSSEGCKVSDMKRLSPVLLYYSGAGPYLLDVLWDRWDRGLRNQLSQTFPPWVTWVSIDRGLATEPAGRSTVIPGRGLGLKERGRGSTSWFCSQKEMKSARQCHSNSGQDKRCQFTSYNTLVTDQNWRLLWDQR